MASCKIQESKRKARRSISCMSAAKFVKFSTKICLYSGFDFELICFQVMVFLCI